MEIKKIEKSDFVMFPRMQHRGLQFRHVERDAYRVKTARCGPRPVTQDGG